MPKMAQCIVFMVGLSLFASGQLVQLAELSDSPKFGSWGGFGDSVAISGDGKTVVVGAPGYGEAGEVFIYVEPASGWVNMTTPTATLTPILMNVVPSEFFGFSVAISSDGSTIVVGEPEVGGYGNGNVFVFVKPVNGWKSTNNYKGQLTASDGQVNDALGTSVAISGNTIVAGAPALIANQFSYGPGAVYVFVQPAGGWQNMTETAKLTASDGQLGYAFGGAAAIYNNTIAVGAEYASVGGNTSEGAAYVFTEPISGWATGTETAKLTASDGNSWMEFGKAVVVSSNTVAAGASAALINGQANHGALYVFTEPPNGWIGTTETAKLTTTENVSFLGWSLTFGSGGLITGAPFSGPGEVYIFREPANGWQSTTRYSAKLTASDGLRKDDFGYSVAFSNGTAVVGAPARGPGIAYVFGP